MATLTTAKGYSKPTVGGDNNLWGGLLNGDLDIVDRNLGGNLSISVAGGAGSTTLSAVQAQNLIIECTGVLTGNRNIVSPAAGGIYIYKNSTTGNFTLTAITSAVGSTGPVLPQGGEPVLVFSDGTDITLVAALPNMYAGTSGGTANAQTLNLSVNAVGAGTRISFTPGATNTGAMTLNGDAVQLLGGAAMVGGEVQSGSKVEVMRSGSAWLLLTPFTMAGTWTPAIALGSGSVTHVTQVGTYYQIGRRMFIEGTVTISAASTPGGAYTITGLPKAAINTANRQFEIKLGVPEGAATSCAGGANGQIPYAAIFPGDSVISIVVVTQSTNGAGTAGGNIPNTTAGVTFSGSYIVDT